MIAIKTTTQAYLNKIRKGGEFACYLDHFLTACLANDQEWFDKRLTDGEGHIHTSAWSKLLQYEFITVDEDGVKYGPAFRLFLMDKQCLYRLFRGALSEFVGRSPMNAVINGTAPITKEAAKEVDKILNSDTYTDLLDVSSIKPLRSKAAKADGDFLIHNTTRPDGLWDLQITRHGYKVSEFKVCMTGEPSYIIDVIVSVTGSKPTLRPVGNGVWTNY